MKDIEPLRSPSRRRACTAERRREHEQIDLDKGGALPQPAISTATVRQSIASESATRGPRWSRVCLLMYGLQAWFK